MLTVFLAIRCLSNHGKVAKTHQWKINAVGNGFGEQSVNFSFQLAFGIRIELHPFDSAVHGLDSGVKLLFVIFRHFIKDLSGQRIFLMQQTVFFTQAIVVLTTLVFLTNHAFQRADPLAMTGFTSLYKL